MAEKEEVKTEEAPAEETTEEEPSEKTTEETPPKEEETEPESRFPQTSEDKRLGYAQRKGEKGDLEPLMKEIRSLKKGLGYSTDEEPLEETKSELEALRTELKDEIQSLKREQGSEKLLGDFIDQFPEYKKYEGKIRKYMNHQSYANIPIGFIADGIAGKELASETRAEAKKADEEAEESKSGGSSFRKPVGKYPDFWKMSSKEFEDYQNQVRGIK